MIDIQTLNSSLDGLKKYFIRNLSSEDLSDRRIIKSLYGEKDGFYPADEIMRVIEESTGTDLSSGIKCISKDRSLNIDQHVFNITREVISSKFNSSEFEKRSETVNIDQSLTISDMISNGGNDNIRRNNDKITAFLMTGGKDYTISKRDVEELILFFNSIPTIQMSMCVPYLNVRFVKGDSKGIKTQDPHTSLFRFLNGGVDPISNVDKSLANFPSMELFTSPQTLVNANELSFNGENRSTTVLDRFQPFLSLNSFKISVESAKAGMFSFKRADMEMTLHDRSRLSEVGDFINPSLFQDSEFIVEYGWSHPMNDTNNVYGMFLNSLRKVEKYKTVNSKFTFSDNNTVSISLNLALLPAVKFKNHDIFLGDTDSVKSSQESISFILKSINEIIDYLRQAPKNDSISNVLSYQIIRSFSDIDSIHNVSDDLKNLLVEFKTSLDSAKSANSSDTAISEKIDSLIASIEKLYGKNIWDANVDKREEGDIHSLNISLSDAINEKIDVMLNEIDKFDLILNEKSDNLDLNRTLPGSIITFGKIITSFVVSTIAQDDSISEVHVIFDRFNNNAGAMGVTSNNAVAKSIASFKIFTEHFRSFLRGIAVDKRRLSMTTSEFLSEVIEYFIDDMTSSQYGLRDFYEKDKDGKVTKKVNKESQVPVDDKIADALKDMGVKDGVFRRPSVNFHMECNPVRGDKDKTIVTIHIFDRAASPYDNYVKLWGTARNDNVKAVYDLTQEQIDNINSIDPAALEKNDADDSHFINARPEVVKRIIRTGVPTIMYGSNTSMIKGVSLTSNYDPLLSTVHMLESGPGTTRILKNSRSPGNLPLIAIPTTISMTMIGCPIIEYGQQFFVDFETGTNADNIYIATNLNHTFTQGSFETTAQFTVVDAYGSFRSMAKELGNALEYYKKNTQG